MVLLGNSDFYLVDRKRIWDFEFRNWSVSERLLDDSKTICSSQSSCAAKQGIMLFLSH